MNINEIQTEIVALFSRYRIPAITKNIRIENFHRWSGEVADHFNLDIDDFTPKMTELFWGAAHIQLSLGYALIARQDCRFPNGTNGKALKDEDLPNAIGMPEIHFWYHIYNTYECIYRCWERMASILKSVCYPEHNEKMYFDQIVETIENDNH
ncbi:MAG: hypothetical protein HN366_07285 [Deltaproteobacteria bacterium]|jgi:hypothetical protein|nr:hypothetical protein [Deltaproteobacteria bacterium]